MENESTKFVPKFESICQTFSEIIDTMIKSVSSLPRVEHFLFQQVAAVGQKHLVNVQLDPELVKEDIIEDTKGRIDKVVHANSHGPTK